jgi:DNA repair photolyase
VGLPERVRVRPDPIICLKHNGKSLSNVESVTKIIESASKMGIKTFSTSFANIYPKVGERLIKNGFVLLEYQTSKKRQIIMDLQKTAGENGAILYTCATPGFPSSRCIDGELLTKLHPKNEPCRTDKAAGQRALCGCTHSIDIGWYDMLCKSGCLYCYANPDRP